MQMLSCYPKFVHQLREELLTFRFVKPVEHCFMSSQIFNIRSVSSFAQKYETCLEERESARCATSLLVLPS